HVSVLHPSEPNGFAGLRCCARNVIQLSLPSRNLLDLPQLAACGRGDDEALGQLDTICCANHLTGRDGTTRESGCIEHRGWETTCVPQLPAIVSDKHDWSPGTLLGGHIASRRGRT